ncbi:biotin--[acetyl-CoA-carboxylase] ligase [Lewinella cohaerens]|uniref:biotin--[acetyl-CoA-carboxylase] ligase n=1 Tax=Lewinella cohaerens TaxID=70995 RepID=UPI000365DB9B|nr:biotin--[acetyl-CoA-carboxylase] ligase [Lewinella cohaerens]
MKFNTLFVGNVVHHFTEVPSTNALALEKVAKTTPSEGTVISADYQTAGRGQIGSSWYASPGKNLLLSVIFRPRWLAARQQFSLSQAVALAVADTISHFASAKAFVKWPNDVYLADKKLAGILIQNSLSGLLLQSSVVGIGLNINEMDFPKVLPRPGSLQQHLGKEVARKEVQHLLFQRLEARYFQLKSNPAIIRADYLRNLYRYQEWHSFQEVDSGKIFTGQIIGVQETGKLAIQMPETHVQYFDLKEVAFL